MLLEHDSARAWWGLCLSQITTSKVGYVSSLRWSVCKISPRFIRCVILVRTFQEAKRLQRRSNSPLLNRMFAKNHLSFFYIISNHHSTLRCLSTSSLLKAGNSSSPYASRSHKRVLNFGLRDPGYVAAAEGESFCVLMCVVPA